MPSTADPVTRREEDRLNTESLTPVGLSCEGRGIAFHRQCSLAEMMASGHLLLGKAAARAVWSTFEVAILGALVPMVRIAAAENTRLGVSTIPDRNREQGKHQQ